MSIKIVLAEDEQIVREALKALLERESDIEVIGVAENGHQAVELAKNLQPDVLIMDFFLPGVDGLEATKQITREVPSTKVLGFSGAKYPPLVQLMVLHGARGFCYKGDCRDEMVHAVKRIATGGTYFSGGFGGN